jgi:hypothetical protein
MGVADDVREDFDRGRSDARRAMVSRRLSADVAMKLRLSLFWPAALAMILTGLVAWRVGHLSAAAALVAALVGGLMALAIFGLFLEALLKRARLAEPLKTEDAPASPAGPAQAA